MSKLVLSLYKVLVLSSRHDVSALLLEWFPEAGDLDAAFFPTPHLLWNLLWSNVSNNQNGMRIPFSDSDLLKMKINKRLAEAFYSTKSYLPQFMTADSMPSGFPAKSTKAERALSQAFKSIPTAMDFGRSGDSDYLHGKFHESELERWFEDHPTGLVLCQGSRSFAKWLHNGYTIHGENKEITIINDLDYTSADGFRVPHAEVGGVTMGQWSVYSEGLNVYFNSGLHVRRKLKHILKSTEKASPLKDIRQSTTPLLRPNQLLPVSWKKPTVKCPSVFNRNKDVLRLLSKDELMEAYDLELGSQAALHKYWNDSGSIATLGFTDQAPLKVLRQILETAFKAVIHFGDNTMLRDHLCPCDNASAETVKLSNVDRNRRITLGDEDTILSDYTEKAARPDDAEADIKDWDIYSVKSFHRRMSLEKFVPLVCTGVYDEEDHSRLFNALRSLLHRRYWKNVTRSLLKHLRNEHGSDKATVFNTEALTIRRNDIVTSISRLKARGLIKENEDESEILSTFRFNDADEVSFSVHPWVTRKNALIRSMSCNN